MKRIDAPLSWPGGKNMLKQKLLPKFPIHTVYAEPFLGAGQMLFWKNKVKFEWVNDKDDILINLWRVLKDEKMHQEFVEYLTNHPKSRSLFMEYREILKDPVEAAKYPPVKRAAMAYFIIKSAFGSAQCFTGKESWGFTPQTSKMRGFYSADWEAVFDRLRDVQIENRDYEDFIKLFVDWAKRKGVKKNHIFMFIDPPYFCLDTKLQDMVYVHNFTIEDHENLARVIKEMSEYCSFMLTIDDCEESRELYKDFTIEQTKTIYTANNDREEGRKVSELMIRNYSYGGAEMKLFH